MATNDKAEAKRGIGSAVTREVEQLRKKVADLTLKLQHATNARELNARMAAEAKKARVQLSGQLKVLGEQGRKLAAQVKSALGDASKRQRLHEEAQAKMTELRAELAGKTAELKRKSQELTKLARESAHRAAVIVRSASPSVAKPAQPSAAPPPAAPSPENRGPRNKP